MSQRLIGAATLAVVSGNVVAGPVTIDFDDQTVGGNAQGFSQDGANFEINKPFFGGGGTGFASWQDSDLLGASFANISSVVMGGMIGSYAGDPAAAFRDVVTVTFDVPIFSFSFAFFLDDGVGGIDFPTNITDVMDVRVYDSGGLIDTLDVGADKDLPGNPYPEGWASYSTLADIVKIEIDLNSSPSTSTTFWNLDNFGFTTVIPLPAPAGLAALGLMWVGVRRHR